ncbi:MAG TPA: DNA/RNA nuclease SfsA [Planctomycetes bacterium]|nr:DNA/RNA nuclease SfsA [Planctomycetota bacterium]HIN80787.1 DNA/RNA nuclease SfsA [Planctomycetota bacterium]
MKLDLVEGRFLRRYKRFLADVELPSGEVVTAHCPNTGSMKTLLREGARAWLRHDSNPKRKLPSTLTLLGVRGRGRALVDTALPNSIVAEAIAAGRVPELAEYRHHRREVKVGERSRLDLALGDGEDLDEESAACFVEIKNVTMLSASHSRRGDFPDAVTARGRKHLEELARLVSMGRRAVQFFLLGRTDCHEVSVDGGIDPDYRRSLIEAADAGVQLLAYRLEVGRGTLRLGKRCPVLLD